MTEPTPLSATDLTEEDTLRANAYALLGHLLARAPDAEVLALLRSIDIPDAAGGLDGLDELAELLRTAIRDDPPLTVREGGIIAEGYHAVVMGADKWRQVIDPAWYGDDPAARDEAVARLPRVLVAPRADDRPEGVELLDVDEAHLHVRASAIRAGDPDAQGWLAT